MIPPAAALALAALAAWAPPAQAETIFDGCEVRARLLLLPEDLPDLDAAPPQALTVTGGYTAAETRATDAAQTGEAPRPVGLLVARGQVVSRELARMDGVLLIAPDGAARITAVDALSADLSVPAARSAYVDGVAEAGGALFQSHLLIRDGALDLRARDDAPEALRRLLLQSPAGEISVWQSRGARTLHAAAAEALAEASPAMALNLDMGGHDFCERATEAGPQACGLVGREGLPRFSSLLRLTPGC